MSGKLLAALASAAAMVTLGPVAGRSIVTSAPSFSHRLPWAGRGVWLKAETHTHSKFSDGAHSIDEVADRAVANACDVLAITDHSDADLKAGAADYHEAIRATRTRLPGLILITGLEWNVPPGRGQDHAVVLWPEQLDNVATTEEFKQRFDDLRKDGRNLENAASAFDWLRARAEASDDLPVIFLNHPGRRAANVDAVFQTWSFLAREGLDMVAGAEGAPGHQHATPLGAYGSAIIPEDRWDPSIVAPGAAWDRLLQQGADVSGALATSDFHSESNGDYWPCEFSYTAVYAPDRSATGVLRALRAGSFLGIHGAIVRNAELRVSAPGLERPAIPGEHVQVAVGTTLSVDLSMDVPPTDWSGRVNRIDTVDLIAVSKEGASIAATGTPVEAGWHAEIAVPAGGVVLRARGRRLIEDGPDLLFYTNGVRISTD